MIVKISVADPEQERKVAIVNTQNTKPEVKESSASKKRTPRLCVSLKPRGEQTLRALCRALDLSPSFVIQLLLDLEDRQGLVRQEVAARLKSSFGLEPALKT